MSMKQLQYKIVKRLHASKMDVSDAENVILFLDTEEMQEEMLRYLEENPKATPEKILEKLRIMLTS